MSLKDEIAALREAFNTRDQKTMGGEEGLGSQPSSDGQGPATAPEPSDIEALLEAMNSALDELSVELDRFPKLTALAAFGFGLALGVLIGRQSR